MFSAKQKTIFSKWRITRRLKTNADDIPNILRNNSSNSDRAAATELCISSHLEIYIVRQLDGKNHWKKPTTSWNNSILALYCSYRPSKCIFVCWQLSNYLGIPANTFLIIFSINLIFIAKISEISYSYIEMIACIIRKFINFIRSFFYENF